MSSATQSNPPRNFSITVLPIALVPEFCKATVDGRLLYPVHVHEVCEKPEHFRPPSGRDGRPCQSRPSEVLSFVLRCRVSQGMPPRSFVSTWRGDRKNQAANRSPRGGTAVVSALFLSLDGFPDFTPVDRHFLWCRDAETYLVAADFDHDNFYVSDADGFVLLTAEYQHGDSFR